MDVTSRSSQGREVFKAMKLTTLITIVAALVIALSMAFVVVGSTPPRTLPIQPRTTWQSQKLDGYIIDRTPQKWVGMIGNTKKEFSWVGTTAEDGPQVTLPLAFADDAVYRKAEQLAGFPVFVTAVQVSRGESLLWVVESISEPK